MMRSTVGASQYQPLHSRLRGQAYQLEELPNISHCIVCLLQPFIFFLTDL